MATRHYYTTNVTSEEQWKKYVQEEDEKRKKKKNGDSSQSNSNKSINATIHHYTTNVTSDDQWKDFVKSEDEKRKKRMYGDSTSSSTQSTFNKPQTQQKAETFKASIPTKSEATFSASTLSDDVSKGTPSVNLAADAQADFSKTNEEAYKKYLQYTTKPTEKKGLYSKLNPNAKVTRTPEEQLDVASDYLSQFTDEQKKMLDAYTNYKRQYDEQMLWSNSLANIGAIGGGGSIDPSMANEQSQYLKGMNESLAQFQESTGLSDEDVQLAIEYAGEVSDRKTRDIQREGFQKNAHDYNNQGWDFETGEKKASTKDVKKTLKAAGGKVFNTLMSAGAQMQSGGWAVGENLIHKFGGYADENAPVNTNSAYYELNNISNDAKAATLKEIEDNNNQVDAFLYKAASSGLENYVRMAPAMMFSQLGTATKLTKALGENASLLPMAANVFSTTVENAQNQGMTADEAQMAGTISATIEYATEKAGFDAVFDNLIVKSNSAFAKRLLASMAAEAGEEFVSGAVSPTLEAVMFGDKSEAIRKYNDLIDDGISESEAKKQVVWEYFKDALSDAAVAAVSTLMMSGPIEVSKDISDTKSGKEVFADDNYKEVAEGIDDTLDIGKEAKAYAEKLADKVENGEKVTSNEKRALWSMVNSNVEQSQQAHEKDLKYREIVDEYRKGTPAENSAKGFSNFMQQTNDILTQKVTNPEMSEEAQVETELRELSPMDNMLVEESEGKSPAYISGVKGEEFAPSNIDEEIAYNEGQQYRTQRKSEENNPKTATAIRGNEKFKIASIKNVKGEPYITTDSGVTMPLSEASIVNDNVQTLYNNASKHDNAQAYIDGYNPNIPVKAYSSAMENVYNYARLHGTKGTFENAIKNEPYKDKIDKASLKAMYEEGLKDTQTKSKKVTKSGKKAQGKVTDENNRLSKNGRKLMKAISNKLGVDVEIVDNQMTVDGKTVNGFFDVDNNKIVLNPDGQNVFKTLIHEVMGEMSEAYSSEKMDELQLAIIDYELARNPKKFNDTVENYRQAYIKHEGAKSYREAADEYVNDILVELFNDEQGVKDFANFIADKQSVKETFLEFIDNIVSAIKELIGDNTNSRFKDDIEAMQRLRKMALDTWQTAIDNKLALENGETELKQASSLDVRNSIEPENNYKISENGEVLITEDGREIPIIKTGDVKVGNKKQNARAQALVRETLRQLRGTSVIIKADERKVYFVKQTEKEYSMSKTTMNLENKERSAKYSAANKIKTIVENAKNPTWKPDENNKHGESAQRGWTYYDVDFIVTEDGKNFEQAQGRLVIRMGVDGRDSVYDIDNIKIETISTSITSPSRQPLSTSSIAPEAEKSTATGSGNDIRKSLEVDTEGRELNDSKKEFFKNSKIVDEDGRLLVLYHGTPVGGFNEFRNPLNFFTPNRAYAERYANQDSKTGEIYEVYLNVEKPFDITNPEDRQIFIDEYVKGGWSYSIDPSLSDKEIAERIKDGIDWTEADNLKEFLEENDYDYDGLILNEGGDFEYGDRDNSYVIFESRQAKRVDNENPTQDADIRFSLDVPEEESKTLIAIHNLSTDEMMKSLDLGGFPMPSIAITKAEIGHTKYGDISVLFGKDTIDPRLSRNNKVYSGDAYTPEFPTVNHKINGKEIVRVRDEVKELVGDLYDAFQNPGLDTSNAEDKLDRSRGSIVDAYGNNDMLEYAFTKAKGEDIELPMREMALSYKFDNDEIKYIALMFPKEEVIDRMNGSYQRYEEALKDGTVDKIIDKLNSFEKKKYNKSKKAYDMFHTKELPFADYDSLMNAIYRYYYEGIKNQVDRLALGDNVHKYVNDNYGEYKEWLNNLFDGVIEKTGIRNNKDTFLPSGNRRSFEQTHYEYNLANIVKAMREEPETGSGFGGYSFLGSVNHKFDSIDDIHSEEDRLQFMEDKKYSELKKEIADELSDIAERIRGNYDKDSTMSDIAEAVAKRKTKAGVKNFLAEWYKVSDADVNEIMALAKKAANLPTGYFEAKPQRAVELSEIERVIVPHLEKDLMAALDEQNIPYTTYKAGDDEARKAAVNSVPEIRFSIEVDSEGNKLSREQQRYFADSKVVDDQGRLKVMFHGTRNGGFTVFDPRRSDDKTSLFFTDNKDVAKSYSGLEADEFIADKEYTFDELANFIEAYTGGDLELTEKDGKYSIEDVAEGELASGTLNEMRDYFTDNYLGYSLDNNSSAFYPVYLNATNPLVVDANGNNWNNINLGKFTMEDDVWEKTSIYLYDFDGKTYALQYNLKPVDYFGEGKEEKKRVTPDELRAEVGDYIADYLLEMDEAINHGQLHGKSIFGDTGLYKGGQNGEWIPNNTRQYTAYAKELGYDSVIFNDLRDSGGQAYTHTPSQVVVVYDSNQVKSIENKTPTKDADIRYSIDVDDIWSGVASALDGHIEEVHSYDEAENSDFNHEFYFSEDATRRIENGESFFFFLDDEGNVDVDLADAPDSIKDAIANNIQKLRDDKKKKSKRTETIHLGNLEFAVDKKTKDFLENFKKSNIEFVGNSREDILGVKRDFYKKYQDGIANKDNYYVNTIAEFEPIKERPNREPDYVIIEEDDSVISEFWYTDDGVIRCSANWGAEAEDSCDWFLGNKSTSKGGSKKYGKAKWKDFMQKTDIGFGAKTHEAAMSTFSNTVGGYMDWNHMIPKIKGINDKSPFDIDMYYTNVRNSLAVDDIKKRAEKRFSFDQADLDLLDSLAEGQNYNKVADDTMAQILSSINNLYKGQEVGAKSIQTVAKEIKEYTGSTISTSKLEEQLKTLFDYMQRADNELNTGEMFDMFKIVAGDVVDKMASEKVDDSFRDFMRTETFRLTDDQKKEVAHVFGSYDNFRKKYFGILKIRNDATSTLDGLWNEITEQSFYGLDKDTPEAEQPIALVDFLDAMKDQPINNFGASFDELSTDVAIRILEKYFAAEQEAMTNKALLDNPSAKKAIDDARANMRKADQEFRKQVKEKYDEEVARLTKERDDAQSSSQFFYNRARDLENQLANASNEEDKKAIRKLQSELDKKEKALIKAKAQSKAPLSAYQEQLGRADEKRKIMQISNRLMKMVYAPTEKLHMPEEFREPIGEFLNGIDFITHRGDLNSIDKMRWQTRMDNLRHYLSELSSKANATQNELNLAELLEDELLEDMEKFTRDHAEDKKISRMSKEELHKLYGILTRLSASVSKTNQTFANQNYTSMTALSEDSYNELVEMNDKNVGNGVMQSIKDFFGKSLEDPITYFSLMGNAPKSIFDGFRRGFDRFAGHVKESEEFKNKNLPSDIYKWEKEKHTFEVPEGELELTTAHIMSLYETYKRKAAGHHTYSGGFKVLYNHLMGYTSQSKRAYHLSNATLQQIFGVLTPEQIEIADKLQQFMANNCADWGNNVSMTVWGYKKFTEKDYFPMKVDSDSRATSNSDANIPNLYANKNMSASKELKEMADNPLIIEDIFDVFTEHVAKMATYDGMVLPQMDAMRWFNYKVKEVDGQGRNFISGTKQEINRIYGKAGIDYFINFIKGINGTEPKARGIQWLNFAIGRYKKLAVVAKVRVAIQQPTAIVRAYDEMEAKYLNKALVTTNPIKYSKIAKENSMLAWWKGQGYYESYTGKGLKEMIVGKNPFLQKLEDFEGWGAQTADDLAWGILYHASELEIKDKHPDLKGKEFTDAVVERFEDLVSKTQVVDTMLHRTDIMRNQGDLAKMVTSFMMEPLKTYNMLMRSFVGAARDKDKKAINKLIRTLFIYLLNNAILSAVTTTWDALRKDDDKTEYADKWLEIYRQTFADNMNPLNMIPVVKDGVETLTSKLSGQYYGSTDMSLEGIAKTGQFIAHVIKKANNKKLTVSDYGLNKEGAQVLSYITGVPIYNVWNDIEGVHNGFFKNWETKAPSDYQKFYDAFEGDGDIQKEVNNLKELGKDDTTIKKQITNTYKQTYLDTTDMTEKANLKNKLIKAYTAAGDTREQAIKKIDKWK